MFLYSFSDHFGFVEDPVFQNDFANYLEEPCLLVVPLARMYFGPEEKHIDEYGANLVSAILPGVGWKPIHDNLESTLQDMMQLGEIHAQRQATIFLLAKVGDLCITEYINTLAKSTRKKRNICCNP